MDAKDVNAENVSPEPSQPPEPTQPPERSEPRGLGDRVRGWYAARSRAMGAGVLILVALAVGRVVNERLPEPKSVGNAPFERVVQIGETAHLRVGDVTVTGIDGGKAWSGITEAKLSPGVWLVADIDLVPSMRKSGISYAAVRDDAGHVWELGRGTSTCKGGIPGIPMACKVLVELPDHALPGAELVLRWTDVDLRWDDQAVIPLTLDEETVSQWATVTEPMLVPLAKVGRE